MIKTFFYTIGLSYIGLWVSIGLILLCAIAKHRIRQYFKRV